MRLQKKETIDYRFSYKLLSQILCLKSTLRIEETEMIHLHFVKYPLK